MYIKGMDKNMQCRGGFQFEVGKEYKIEHEDKPLDICSDTVFHYCSSLQEVHNFYPCNADNRFFEIEVLGEEITDGIKHGSDHIKILREIAGTELEQIKDPNGTNVGLFNSGIRNSGNWNSGNNNSGNWNSGNNNSGNGNSGNNNSGNGNSGNNNSDARNSGCWNSGSYNSGNCNSGNSNSGNNNSGHGNSGNWNSGNYNSGFWNTGDNNSGNWNSGNYNSGDHNSGDCNNGDRNSGFANQCNYSSGVFCNQSDNDIRIFNKPSGMSLLEFYASKYWSAICSVPLELTKWVDYSTEEKAKDLGKEKIGGYLKTYTYKEMWANWWNKLTDENKEIIKQIPNFDPEVFKDITGIEV